MEEIEKAILGNDDNENNSFIEETIDEQQIITVNEKLKKEIEKLTLEDGIEKHEKLLSKITEWISFLEKHEKEDKDCDFFKNSARQIEKNINRIKELEAISSEIVQKNKNHNSKMIIFASLTILFIVSFVCLYIWIIKPNFTYNKAQRLVENNQYLEAISLYQSINKNEKYNEEIVNAKEQYIYYLAENSLYDDAYEYAEVSSLDNIDEIEWKIINKAIEDRDFENISYTLKKFVDHKYLDEEIIYKSTVAFNEISKINQNRYDYVLGFSQQYLNDGFSKYAEEMKALYVEGFLGYAYNTKKYKVRSTEYEMFEKFADTRVVTGDELKSLFTNKTINQNINEKRITITCYADGSTSEKHYMWNVDGSFFYLIWVGDKGRVIATYKYEVLECIDGYYILSGTGLDGTYVIRID